MMSLILICLFAASIVSAQDVEELNGCSYHLYASCSENAICNDIDITVPSWECVCPDGLEGNPYQGYDDSGCGPKKCNFDDECHSLAICNEAATCECQKGYAGDGINVCLDVNECAVESPCHLHAVCTNTEGSYVCTCKESKGYVGDGFTCNFRCSVNLDCQSSEMCQNEFCVCRPGYEEKNGVCRDIDECSEDNDCHQYARCINEPGSYSCECENGFEGDGLECTAIPTNCQAIKNKLPDTTSGEYEIDPDGAGPLGTTMVICEIRLDFAITIFPLVSSRPTLLTKKKPRVDLDYANPIEAITAVIAASEYCYQDMGYKGRKGPQLMDGDDFWVNGNGEAEHNWGGSPVEGKCACGAVGMCTDQSASCNCDGENQFCADDGKIINKEKLPITAAQVKPGNGYGYLKIGSVKCADQSFDLPQTCHEAKFNKYMRVRKDGPLVIDVDKEGPLYPFLVYCDMRSYSHVGLTVIPHSNPYPTNVTVSGEVPIDYIAEKAKIKGLLEVSAWCTQDASYECKNSRLLNNGDKKGWFSDIEGNEKDYWPGGLQQENKCACGVMDMCEDDTFGCNCDSGGEGVDFGVVYNKEDLPIGSITLLEIGGNSWGRYTIGPMKCGGREFGIAPTCQEYVEDGYYDSSVYLIDPDGPANPRLENEVNEPPFPVYCEMSEEPPMATTIVFHDFESRAMVNGKFEIMYTLATAAQLEVLVQRAQTCTQSLDYSCKRAPLHSSDPSSPYTTWGTKDGRQLTYFGGDGSKSNACDCFYSKPRTCPRRKRCNCDKVDRRLRNDDGLLTNKFDLPVFSFNFTGLTVNSEADLALGPLKCREIFPNCGKKKIFNKEDRLSSEPIMRTGFYAIDPDGTGPLEPFTVECIGTRTVVETTIDPQEPTDGDPDSPVSQCYKISYQSNGQPISPEQIQALVDSSASCGQQLSQTCLNAPLTDHSNFSTCDGKSQPGWAGSRGRDMCACGVTGGCAGGPDAKCNCDLVDGTQREDQSWMMDSHRLAVCEVCIGLDPVNDLDITPKERSVQPMVSDLFCDIDGINGAGTCQDWRNLGMDESGTVMVEPDGTDQAFPVYCDISAYPPMGVTEIRPKEPEIVIPPEGVDIDIEYYVYSMSLITSIIKQSRYCTQEMYVDCDGSSLELGGAFGWFSRNGGLQVSWAGNYEGTPTCAGGQCKCDLGGKASDGGIIIDTSKLPVTRVYLGPASGTRTLRLGPVKCYDLYRTCHEIHLAKAKKNPLKNNTYAVDPDLGGGVDAFAVTCDFKTNEKIGITEVAIDTPAALTLKRKRQPDSFHTPITYVDADYDQINELAAVSEFCFQNIQFICVRSGLIMSDTETNGYYNTYGDVQSPSFGIAGDSSSTGCACTATNSCPDDSTCRCNAKGRMKVDYGYETNRTVLPIESFTFGSQTARQASAVFSVGSVYCGPQPFYLPEDCDEAYERGFKSGEVLIWPSTSYEPFLVSCVMNRFVRRGGVTVVSPKPDTEVPVTFDSNTPVEYYQASIEQLVALAEVSAYCYQPFKVTCRNTKLMTGDGYFYWEGSSTNTQRKFVGAGRWFAEECTCGSEGQCGGSEEREVLMNLDRPCSCDAGDNETRADAGIFNKKNILPINSYFLADSGIADSFAAITVGNLYCGEKEFDLNECKLGFHDCHEHAECINNDGAFECHCKPGWRGLGRPDVWANGRNCYDDDECALFMCSDRAICTNLPGDYDCTCKEGYEQLSKHRCRDIDECALGTHNCSENARCINLIGSYDCRCDFDYRGDGFTCEAMATCACFGDPHCLTYDNRLVDYQGLCEYTMARDGCDALDQPPTFELLTTFTSRDVDTYKPATWVKEVTFKYKTFTVRLMQGKEVRVNGRRVNLPFRRPAMKIRLVGNYVEIYTNIGIEVNWDGNEAVQMHTSGQWMGKTCGLCGNYNQDPADDLVIGPACPNKEGEVTDNSNVFGESWVTADSVANSPTCEADCNATDDNELCTGMKYQLAKAQCDNLYDVNGQFRDCLITMDTILVESLYHSCIYDLCRVTADPAEAICDSAQALVETCLLSNIEVESFRSSEFCPITCDENMEYMICGSTTTCADLILNEPIEEVCQEGCYCKDGFVMDGDQCVLEENCGCIYMDGYYSLGEEVPSEGCGTQAICQGNNNVVEEGLVCHQDAVCELRNGVYGCHCKENFLGDGVESCTQDACEPDPCGVNETCIRDPERELGYECKCSMGFIGDCNNCTELDECSVYKNICPPFSECINTVGSFECECGEGFFMFNGMCQDINECEMAKETGEKLCGENSQCSNKMGDFECPCCNGFVDNGNGTCVEAEGVDPGGEKCCTCEMDICKEPGKVCSEDQVEFGSLADLIIARCEQNESPRWQEAVDYFGPCKSTCGGVTCPLYQFCIVDGATGLPTCVCEECTAAEANSDKVCSSNLDVYPNLCVFKTMQCYFDEEAVPLDVMKPCDDKLGQSPVGEWTEWGPCSVTCGKGTRERTRETYRPLEGFEVQDYPLSLVTACYEDPCPGSACEGAICYAVSAECVEDAQGNAVCECPECTNINNDDPVCGFIQLPNGNIRTKTYPSACNLAQKACESGYPDFGVINEGDCSLVPMNCTRVPDQEPRFITGGPANSYKSSKQMFGFGCVGGCGNIKEDCCRPADTEMIDVELVDPNNKQNKITKQIEVVKSCECVDLEEEESGNMTP